MSSVQSPEWWLTRTIIGVLVSASHPECPEIYCLAETSKTTGLRGMGGALRQRHCPNCHPCRRSVTAPTAAVTQWYVALHGDAAQRGSGKQHRVRLCRPACPYSFAVPQPVRRAAPPAPATPAAGARPPRHSRPPAAGPGRRRRRWQRRARGRVAGRLEDEFADVGEGAAESGLGLGVDVVFPVRARDARRPPRVTGVPPPAKKNRKQKKTPKTKT
jgi:hypothetical protein